MGESIVVDHESFWNVFSDFIRSRGRIIEGIIDEDALWWCLSFILIVGVL